MAFFCLNNSSAIFAPIQDILNASKSSDPIANLVKYLVSNEAKGLTGQNINLCAGLSCGC